MANLTYDQQNQMLNTKKINRDVGHYFAEKQGDSDKFKAQVDQFKRFINRAIVWGGAK